MSASLGSAGTPAFRAFPAGHNCHDPANPPGLAPHRSKTCPGARGRYGPISRRRVLSRHSREALPRARSA